MARHVGHGEAIGRRIATARKARGWTQAEFARLFGVSVRMLQYWESGEVVPYRYLERLADMLGCTSEWLLYGTEPDHRVAEHLTRSRERLAAETERLQRNLQTLAALHESTLGLVRSACGAHPTATVDRSEGDPVDVRR